MLCVFYMYVHRVTCIAVQISLGGILTSNVLDIKKKIMLELDSVFLAK